MNKILNWFINPDVWLEFPEYIEEAEQRSLNAFQQDTRRQSLRNITKEEGFFR